MDVHLTTDRLVLRRFTPDDLDPLEALDADPTVMRFINGGRPTPREELRDDVLPAWLRWYERPGGWGFWAATEGSRALIDEALTEITRTEWEAGREEGRTWASR